MAELPFMFRKAKVNVTSELPCRDDLTLEEPIPPIMRGNPGQGFVEQKTRETFIERETTDDN